MISCGLVATQSGILTGPFRSGLSELRKAIRHCALRVPGEQAAYALEPGMLRPELSLLYPTVLHVPLESRETAQVTGSLVERE
jgi:hypothetical protein